MTLLLTHHNVAAICIIDISSMFTEVILYRIIYSRSKDMVK